MQNASGLGWRLTDEAVVSMNNQSANTRASETPALSQRIRRRRVMRTVLFMDLSLSANQIQVKNFTNFSPRRAF
jgi:hypothetical protein